MDDRALLGRRIKELRTRRGLSQEKLAEAMRVNWKYLSSVERGRENPTLDFLVKLSASLGVELADLFSYRWLRLNERELRRQIKTIADTADVDALREMLILVRSRAT